MNPTDPTELVVPIDLEIGQRDHIDWADIARGTWLGAAKKAGLVVVSVDYQTLAPGVAGRVMIGGTWYNIVAGQQSNTVTVAPVPIPTDPNEQGEFSWRYGDTEDDTSPF
jgi:hypothetical protein